MIFLSHQHNDKAIVGPIAQRLKEVYGEENVFFDDWSIQPGQGIIDRMNNGLEDCRVFFFFISENSLQSDMVKLEWQNIIMRESKHDILFVPIRMTNVEMPAILSQKLYLDMFSNGIDITIKQMVDLVENGRLKTEEYKPYENIIAYALVETNEDSKDIHFYIYAKTFYEPICRFLVLADIDQSQGQLSMAGGGLFASNFYSNVKTVEGKSLNGFYIGKDSGITPGFVIHLTLKITNSTYLPTKVELMRSVSDHNFRVIPTTQISDENELPRF